MTTAVAQHSTQRISRRMFFVIAAAVLFLSFGYIWNQIVYQHSAQYAIDRSVAALNATLPKPTQSYQVTVFGKSFLVTPKGVKPTQQPIVASEQTSQPSTTVALPDLANPDDMTLQRPPSLTPEQIDAILASYRSPAAGEGQTFYDLGLKYDIDPAYALAFFIQESTAGTANGWAGLKPDGSSTHNIGNIICTGSTACYGRFRDYPTWDAGIEDWYRLLSTEYIPKGLTTVELVIPIYAPSFENDVNGYTNTVSAMVGSWRKTQVQAAAAVQGQSVPITVGASDFGINVRAALTARNGSLQDITIQPGEQWSFNETIGDPGVLDIRTMNGVPGSGWCDLASRYVQALRPILPPSSIQFQLHGIVLNQVDYNDSVMIWTDGHRGGQDLLVTNTTDRPIHIWVADAGSDTVVIEAAQL